MDKQIMTGFVVFLIMIMGIGVHGCVNPNNWTGDNKTNHTTNNSTNYSTNNSVSTNNFTSTDLASANNQFAIDLYSDYKSENDNIFFSPWSISSALAMTYEGARGQTATEMAKVFYFPSNLSEMESDYQIMNSLLNKKNRSYSLWNANSLWIEKTYTLNSSYASKMQTYYGGIIASLDFKQEPDESRTVINNWVENKTNDHIKDILPSGSITTDTRLVLANAIYMKANWSEPFDKNLTQEKEFYLSSGQKTKVSMMYQQEHFRYGETNEFQMVELPYAGNELSMLVILPKDDFLASITGGNMKAVENSLSAQNLAKWKKEMKTEDVKLSLPKFKFETEYQLGKQLKKMGMPTAFSQYADFSGIGPENLAISEVFHKAFVEVDEQSTEAAAATVVVIGTTSAPITQPPPPKVFNANHPFIFIIQERSTCAILFLGKVNDPTK